MTEMPADGGGGAGRGQSSPRHYPLDMAHLPFDRYDRRRITARDIMVHRLMADFMSPARVPGRVYDGALVDDDDDDGDDDSPACTCTCTACRPPSAPQSNARCVHHPFHAYDLELDADVGVLENMLFTSAARPRRRVAPGERGNKKEEEGPFGTVAEHLLDLVARHYLETDDAAMRVWVTRAALPRVPAGPVVHVDVIRRLAQRRAAAAEDEGGRDRCWHPRQRDHLRRLRAQVAVQDERLPLYDGGACLAALYRVTDRHARGAHGARQAPLRRHWAIDDRDGSAAGLPTWPEYWPLRRYVFQPAWPACAATGLLRDRLARERRPLDLCLAPRRGRNRDGIWATG